MYHSRKCIQLRYFVMNPFPKKPMITRRKDYSLINCNPCSLPFVVHKKDDENSLSGITEEPTDGEDQDEDSTISLLSSYRENK